jgi:hypothetical protein
MPIPASLKAISLDSQWYSSFFQKDFDVAFLESAIKISMISMYTAVSSQLLQIILEYLNKFSQTARLQLNLNKLIVLIYGFFLTIQVICIIRKPNE